MSRFGQNTLMSAVETFLLIVSSIIATPLILNGLGPVGYGVFVFLSLFSVTGVLSFFDFGMEGAVMTAIAKSEATNDSARTRSLHRTAVLFYSAMGVLLGALLALLLQFLVAWMKLDTTTIPPVQLQMAALLTCVNIVIQFTTIPFVALLQGQQRLVGIKTSSILISLVQYTGIILLATLSPRLDLIVALITTMSVLRFLAAWWLSRSTFAGSNASETVTLQTSWRELRTATGWLFGNRLVGLVYNQTHKGLISVGLPISNLGLFDIVARPASFFRVLLGVLYSAVIPKSASLTALQQRSGLTELFTRLVTIASLLLLPVGCWLIGQAVPILIVWIGPDYANIALPLQLLIVAGILNIVTSIMSTMAVGMEIVPRTLRISITVTLVNLIASIALIPWLGLTGASLALCLAEAVGLPMTLSLASQALPGSIEMLSRMTIRMVAVALIMIPAQLLIAGSLSSQPWLSVLIGLLFGAAQTLFNFTLLPVGERDVLFHSVRSLVRTLGLVRGN